MKFVPDWRRAHRMWSVQISVLGAVLNGAWMALPSVQELMPPRHFFALNIGLALAVLWTRLLDQGMDGHVDAD